MSKSLPTVCVTDGVIKHVVVALNNNVSNQLLRAMFQTDIIGLRCIDTRSDTAVFNVSCIDGQYNVISEEHFIYKTIVQFKGIMPNTEFKETRNDLHAADERLRSIREKSLTPTNNSDNAKLSAIEKILQDLTLNIDKKFEILNSRVAKVEDGLNSRVVKVEDSLNSLSNDLNMLYELVQPIIVRAIDPWDITARSQGTSITSLPKHVIITYYGIHENQCMICGRCNDVVNAHIWPKHTRGENLLSMFGLAPEDLNDPRNYLRFSKSLELAFDNKTITIIYENGKLLLFVLDDVLKKEIVSNTKYTFNDCHLWPLKFGNSNRPILRILAAHCRNAFMDAFRLKRITFEIYQRGYSSSLAMLNASPEGHKAKILEWFERNEKMVKYKQRS